MLIASAPNILLHVLDVLARLAALCCELGGRYDRQPFTLNMIRLCNVLLEHLPADLGTTWASNDIGDALDLSSLLGQLWQALALAIGHYITREGWTDLGDEAQEIRRNNVRIEVPTSHDILEENRALAEGCLTRIAMLQRELHDIDYRFPKELSASLERCIPLDRREQSSIPERPLAQNDGSIDHRAESGQKTMQNEGAETEAIGDVVIGELSGQEGEFETLCNERSWSTKLMNRSCRCRGFPTVATIPQSVSFEYDGLLGLALSY